MPTKIKIKIKRSDLPKRRGTPIKPNIRHKDKTEYERRKKHKKSENE